MPVFEYKARDRTGKLIAATMEAGSERDVAASLRQKGYFISEIKAPKKGLNADIKLPKWLDFGSIPNVRDITIFSRQFATVINAGLPVVQSLAILQRQADKEGLKDALRKVREDVETGQQLSDGLAKHPRLFNKLYIYLVRAGEVSGNLDGILERIAAYMEKQAALRGKIKTALTYPTVVLVIALAVTWFLLTGIVPQFAQILDQLGGDLPVITRALIAISDFLRFQWYFLAVIIIAIVVGVALDTVQQIQQHMMLRHYEGFMKKGRVRFRGRQRLQHGDGAIALAARPCHHRLQLCGQPDERAAARRPGDLVRRPVDERHADQPEARHQHAADEQGDPEQVDRAQRRVEEQRLGYRLRDRCRLEPLEHRGMIARRHRQ